MTNCDILAGQLSEVSTVIFVFKHYDNIFFLTSQWDKRFFFFFLLNKIGVLSSIYEVKQLCQPLMLIHIREEGFLFDPFSSVSQRYLLTNVIHKLLAPEAVSSQKVCRLCTKLTLFVVHYLWSFISFLNITKILLAVGLDLHLYCFSLINLQQLT